MCAYEGICAQGYAGLLRYTLAYGNADTCVHRKYSGESAVEDELAL